MRYGRESNEESKWKGKGEAEKSNRIITRKITYLQRKRQREDETKKEMEGDEEGKRKRGEVEE